MNYAHQGRWKDAVQAYEQSLQLERRLGDRYGEAQTLNNLGLIHADHGRFEDAIASYEQSLNLMRQLGDRYGEAQTLSNLGLAVSDRGDISGATRLLREALDIFDDLGLPEAEMVRTLLQPVSRAQLDPSSD